LAARHHFIEDTGLTTWPDATSAGCYRFQHALYQQVLYEQLGTARRVHLHRLIGERLQASYGNRAGEIVAQLAVHFERGREVQRAVHYRQQVGEHAAQRNAHHEAIAAVNKALGLLATLPDSSERTRHELALQLALGELLMPVKDLSAPEVGEVYTRAHALCQQVGETPQIFRVLWGLFLFHGAQAQLDTASELGQQLLQLAQRHPDTGFMVEGILPWGLWPSIVATSSPPVPTWSKVCAYPIPYSPLLPTSAVGLCPGLYPSSAWRRPCGR
jgi:predicted ATPase